MFTILLNDNFEHRVYAEKSEKSSLEHMQTSMKHRVHILGYVLSTVIVLFAPVETLGQFKLTVVEKMVQTAHPLPNITHDRLKHILSTKDSNQVVIFDVREEEEYVVSHIRRAIRVDADISSEEFVKLHGNMIKGKLVVFYCSVGYRSSIALERLKTSIIHNGAIQVANLLGGIFRWFNEGNAVVNTKGPTNEMHPYNQYWGKLVQKR